MKVNKMKKRIVLSLMAVFFLIINTVFATEFFTSNEDYKRIVSQQDIDIFYRYVTSNQMERNNYGDLLFKYMEYSEMGNVNHTAIKSIDSLFNPKFIFENTAIYKFQKPNHDKISFITPGYEALVCKYYNDEDIEANKLKYVPKGEIKIPYVKAHNLKVAKNDLKYKPIAYYPFRNNYWAGARQACLDNGMRLPTKLELEQLYQNRALFGLEFEKTDYWTSEEMSSCFADALTFRGVTVHSSRDVDISTLDLEVKQYLDNHKVKLSTDDREYYEVYRFGYRKDKKDILLRCVR